MSINTERRTEPVNSANNHQQASEEPAENGGETQPCTPGAEADPIDQVENGEPPTLEEALEWKEQAAKAKDHYERLLRITADFENYKKRAARERLEAIRYANEGLLESLIQSLDHFDMALAAASDQETATLEGLRTGIEMVYGQFKNVLTEAGLEEIDATGKPFDPNWHEAVEQEETSEVPEGQVLKQNRKGYKLLDRLIRPASVIVAKTPSS